MQVHTKGDWLVCHNPFNHIYSMIYTKVKLPSPEASTYVLPGPTVGSTAQVPTVVD